MKKFLHWVSSVHVIITTTILLTTSALAYLELLFISLTLPLWLIITIVLIPYLLFFVARIYWLSRKRKYNTGDEVNIVGDTRKFVVIRYHNFLPLYAACKQYNANDLLCVHQKYLKPYSEPEKDPFSILRSLENPLKNLSTDKSIRKATIKRL